MRWEWKRTKYMSEYFVPEEGGRRGGATNWDTWIRGQHMNWSGGERKRFAPDRYRFIRIIEKKSSLDSDAKPSQIGYFGTKTRLTFRGHLSGLYRYPWQNDTMFQKIETHCMSGASGAAQRQWGLKTCLIQRTQSLVAFFQLNPARVEVGDTQIMMWLWE